MLTIIGVCQPSEAYPNVLYRMRLLQESNRFNCRSIVVPFWTASLAKSVSRRSISLVWRVIFAHIVLLYRYLRAPRADVGYIPYPAIGPLLVMKFLPKRLRPRVIAADFFISAFDTSVNDRKLLAKGSVTARLVYKLEKWAAATADLVICDTDENREWMADCFQLPATKVHTIPLATNEYRFKHADYAIRKNQQVRVLFVGTLIPLHGIGTIVAAARKLAHLGNIRILVIGDGQDAGILETALLQDQGLPIDWERSWQTPDGIFREIAKADICLGIFGQTEKAQRVCPLKIYAYACVGRPIITGDTRWLKNIRKARRQAPFACSPSGNGDLLARKIIELAENPRLRAALALESRRFYEEELANTIGQNRLETLLLEACST